MKSIDKAIVGYQLKGKMIQITCDERSKRVEYLRFKPGRSLLGSRLGVFVKTSARNANDGVVIFSPSPLNSNQVPHSRPPPPTVVDFVRFGWSILFFTSICCSWVHLIRERNLKMCGTGTETACEGWVYRGCLRAYAGGRFKLRFSLSVSLGFAPFTPKMTWVIILTTLCMSNMPIRAETRIL